MPTIKVVMPDEVQVDPNTGEEEIVMRDLDAKYVVCPTCEGEGETSNYLGSFSMSEMAEMDEDWKDDYLAGRFDRPCEECNGARVILVPDEETANPEVLRIYREQQEEAARYEHERRMESAAERYMEDRMDWYYSG